MLPWMVLFVALWFVLRGVDLAVAKGEVCVLLGPSGGGKSTLLRTINGLESFDAGFFGISPREAQALGIAYVSEDRRKLGLALTESIAATFTPMLPGTRATRSAKCPTIRNSGTP